MKNLIIIIALLSGPLLMAQNNKNSETETVITKKTVTDNQGSRTATKTESHTKRQKARFNEEDSGKINQTPVMEPVEVDTQVSYGFEGDQFQFTNHKNDKGYRLMTVKDNNKEYAIIKPTSQEGYYIISKNGESAFGFYNKEGDFVIERYDAEKDEVISDVYKVDRENFKATKKGQ